MRVAARPILSYQCHRRPGCRLARLGFYASLLAGLPFLAGELILTAIERRPDDDPRLWLGFLLLFLAFILMPACCCTIFCSRIATHMNIAHRRGRSLAIAGALVAGAWTLFYLFRMIQVIAQA